MLLFFSILLLNISVFSVKFISFKHFKKDGFKQYCMVDYGVKEIHCIYESKDECKDDYKSGTMAVCFPRKNLKLNK